MRDTAFFEQLRQQPLEENGHQFCSPCFYYDITTINVAFLAPLKRLAKHLPSKHMRPLRMSLWHGILAITAFEYRDSDIGPYNEVSISIPVTLGKSAPVFFGAMRALQEPMTYVWQLPVTTEIARYGGVEFYGFPKFIAEIEFQRTNNWTHCHLAADGQDILTISARQIETQQVERSRMHALTMREARILRSEVIVNPRQHGVSRRADDVRLELGDHPIAEELRNMSLGRMIQLQTMPANQAILTYALESYVA